MKPSLFVFSITAVFVCSLICAVILLVSLVCIFIYRKRRAQWSQCYNDPTKIAENWWNLSYSSDTEQPDVEEVMNRQLEKTYRMELQDESSIGAPCPVYRINNEIASVLAVDKLLDRAFLISDKELECFAPQPSLKIIAAKRDKV
ncbi:hypothetical protein AB6A40_000836 [Gnathostoma spinigerum]|uniref:Uncharacterized protein n=1 Tax=Gnathostoma spinigerum TaxID=75299 RepID=A0ABD6E4Z3_9BILA